MRTVQASGTRRCVKRHVCAIVPLVCIVIVSVSLAVLLEMFCPPQPVQTVQAAGETATIQINGPLHPPGFFPAITTIHVDDYVTFINQASPPATFILSDANGDFNSPAIAPGKEWTTTFSSPGAYEYHEIASSPRMVGMVVVVANSISLLPTPAPQVEATAIALIETGKTPSDNLAIPTPTSATATRLPSTPAGSESLPLLLFFSSLLVVFILIILLLIRTLRRRRLRKQQNKDGGEPVEGAVREQQQKSRSRFRWRRRKKSNNEDDDEEEEDGDD